MTLSKVSESIVPEVSVAVPAVRSEQEIAASGTGRTSPQRDVAAEWP
ncbi:hypothetical protein [Spongiactinospora sp. TRM90649]|nr:hypothetical protein [Spongiactinospora sp. TRM90649]MDF5757515.1 hypothetical protein [Spongiactinospora sp. TRM90649]